jgi:hypothetical protein
MAAESGNFDLMLEALNLAIGFYEDLAASAPKDSKFTQRRHALKAAEFRHLLNLLVLVQETFNIGVGEFLESAEEEIRQLLNQ